MFMRVVPHNHLALRHFDLEHLTQNSTTSGPLRGVSSILNILQLSAPARTYGCSLLVLSREGKRNGLKGLSYPLWIVEFYPILVLVALQSSGPSIACSEASSA
jgi:hypothetical protein